MAENLGVITPEVEALRERFGFPGMAILQFALGSDAQGSTFIPHNYPRPLVVYTGTHDNDTTVGWWTAGVGDSTRSLAEVERERDFARRYMNTDGKEIHWDFIRTILASVAELAIAPHAGRAGQGERGAHEPARPAGRQLALALRGGRPHGRGEAAAAAVHPDLRPRPSVRGRAEAVRRPVPDAPGVQGCTPVARSEKTKRGGEAEGSMSVITSSIPVSLAAS